MQPHDDLSREAAGDAPAGGPPRRRQAHHALLFGRPRWRPNAWIVVGAVGLAATATIAAIVLWREIDWGEVTRFIARLDAVPLVVAMSALPLIGFPILPVYLVAGARFGAIGGGVVVTLVTAAHLAGSYLIARTVLRRPLQRLLARWHTHLPHIPRDEEPMVALIAALIPGLPYFARNYLFAMAGLRLRIYFWICVPIYVARAYVSILVGQLSGAPDRSRLLMLAGIEALKVAVCAIVIWRLREHHRRFHGSPTVDAPGASST